MSIPISQQEQSLHEQIAHANQKIVAMGSKLHILDEELAALLGRRERYHLFEDVCASLEKLSRKGAADLFREATGLDPEKQVLQIRDAEARFEQNIAAVEKLRSIQQTEINEEMNGLRILSYQLADIQEKVEDLNNEYLLERKPREITYRPTAMPWSVHGEDEQRFRKILFVFVLFAIVFGGVIPIIKPPVERSMGIVVPERIARIIKKKQEAKPEEPKPVEKESDKKDKKEEKVAKKIPSEDMIKPPVTEAQKARTAVESKGVLAFKNNFSELMVDEVPLKIGAAARITNKANAAAGGTASQRSIIAAQGTGGSGGINTSTISRQGTGGGGQRIAVPVVNFTRIESAASTATAETERLLSKGGGKPSRTDEEIQIIFDRYKAALYRIYNRELRVNPTLRGRMVLRIVIEPDGRVSGCTVKSSDLTSPALSAEIVSRVLSFNFGVKEGVSTVTILYPIDFLPAN